jgi:hypothetical protein
MALSLAHQAIMAALATMATMANLPLSLGYQALLITSETW